MNADQQQLVAEMLLQNLQHMNESGTAEDVVQALNLINLFMGVEMDGEEQEYKEEYNDEQKENQEVLPPLVDSDDDNMPALVNAVEYDSDSDYDDMPALVNAVEYDSDSDYDDMPALVDANADYEDEDHSIG